MKSQKPKEKKIEVIADWIGLASPKIIGTLSALPSKGKEIFSFEYDEAWLTGDQLCLLDPALIFYSGKHYPPEGQQNFGVFLDSSPDRWGRMLLDRREAFFARSENRAEKKLVESDYLLGVYDEHRMGGLRFRLDTNGPYLDDNKQYASPPWASLRALEQASLALESNDVETNPNYSKWLTMLVAPGASLGGARPKSGVIDEKNQQWIAKFPSTSDEFDVGAWEMLASELAKRAGVNMAMAKLDKFASKQHTFLTKRFDRTAHGERLHFASAMTLLQYNDGDDAAAGVSYLELAKLLIQNGATNTVNDDLSQLWRRIVFYLCISNTDDHLRNHGFILEGDGWRLSPAYDVNPCAYGNGLTLNISEKDNTQDLQLALSVAEFFRLDNKMAEAIMGEVKQAVKKWPEVAKTLGISSAEQERMKRAFRLVE